MPESQTGTETAGVEYIPTETEVTEAGNTPEGASLVTVQIDKSIPKRLSKFLDPSLMKFLLSSWSTILKAPDESEASQMPIMSEAIQSIATQQVTLEGMQASIPGMIPVPMQVPTQFQSQDSCIAPPIDLSQKSDMKMNKVNE